jgi:transcriptional regulator with XRE-family HTH domain
VHLPWFVEIGKYIGMHKSALSEIENGKRNSYLLTLKLIADTINVDVKDFL